jgi:hypothetical protein
MSGWIFIALHLDFTEAHLSSSGNTRILLPILTLQPCLGVLPCIFHWFRRQRAPIMLIFRVASFCSLAQDKLLIHRLVRLRSSIFRDGLFGLSDCLRGL